jgi:patatin-like phospholipase/acyl hydrolase
MNRRGFLRAGSVAAVAGLACSVSAQAKEMRKAKKADQSKYLILACDGGGMRGYLSSLIMQKLNQDLSILGDNNQGIDLYAGTSTGGLIALGLAAGKTIDEVVELYEDDGAAIFSPLSQQSPCVQALPSFLRKYKSVSELYQVEYDDISNPSVSTVLQDFIPGNPILNTLPNKVMVTTLQLAAELSTGTSWNPLIIENLTNSAGASTHLWDAALSTSAAPIYFPPYKHPDFGWCSDGGLFANNPAPQAVALAIQTGIPLSNISVLSIGTGLANASMAVDESKGLCYGVTKWVSLEQNGPTPKLPLFNSVMDGVASTNDYLCGQMLGHHYLRINPPLGSSVSMDDHSDATMQMYRDAASALFENDEWKAIKTWVQQNFRR